MVTLFSPSRAVWVWARGGWKRVRCGQRFGHFRVEGEFGHVSCSRCGTPLL